MHDDSIYDWTIAESLKLLFETAVAKYQDKELLTIEDEGTYSFAEFKKEVDRVADVLTGLGVNKGDLVGVMLPNTLLFPVTTYACFSIGAVMIPVNITYRSEDARYVLNYSELGTLVTTTELYNSTIAPIRESCPHLKQVLVDGDTGLDDPNVFPLKKLVKTDPAAPPAFEIKATDLATILFTSGTTGYPKGCMHDQTYWLYLAKKVVNYAGLTADDVLLTAQPFYYMDPQWNLVACFMSGAKLILMKRFSPTRFWEHLVNYKVTWCNAIMANLLHQTMPPDIKEKHSLRLMACTIIPTALHQDLEDKTGVVWRANFGMTETGCDLLVPIEAEHLVGSGCIGRAVWGREVRVVDENDQDVEPGQPGEMLLRGKGIMQGYYKNREATDEAFRGGWFHTGDLVTMDQDGWVYFKGRKKDMVRRSGENISTLEVENILVSHPKVKDAAVLAVPDDVRGEEVKAYIIPADGESAETIPPQELTNYCSERLAPFKVPRYFEYVDDMPRTSASEKVEKYKLKEQKEDLRLGSYDRVDKIWR